MRSAEPGPNLSSTDDFDVIVVGGGPAGAVMAWALATRGVRVVVLERAVFPREKVCGDFVEPGGLRILAAMGLLDRLAGPDRPPITANRIFFGPKTAYKGPIPHYDTLADLPPHGLIIPRSELDTVILECAEAASARVMQGAAVTGLRREDGRMTVAVEQGDRRFTLRSNLVIGADGAESLVARAMGLRSADRRHIGLSMRAYVEGVDAAPGEASVWFDEDLYPGYGWMFPMGGGRANVGVGMLSETCDRFDLSVPKAFAESIARLRIRHPGCRAATVVGRPMGGMVKMYGGAGRNHFDGGLLIGDAGSFVDPVTGEGISQGMESALIAASTVMDALEQGRYDAAFLSMFERDFRAYFDPSMRYLTLCAMVLRNRHFRDFWLSATRQGFERAQNDPDFGRVAGAAFGGLNVQPLAIATQIWSRLLAHAGKGLSAAIGGLISGEAPPGSEAMLADLAAWERGWTRSMQADPTWHVSWLADVVTAAAKVKPSDWTTPSPRALGPFA